MKVRAETCYSLDQYLSLVQVTSLLRGAPVPFFGSTIARRPFLRHTSMEWILNKSQSLIFALMVYPWLGTRPFSFATLKEAEDLLRLTLGGSWDIGVVLRSIVYIIFHESDGRTACPRPMLRAPTRSSMANGHRYRIVSPFLHVNQHLMSLPLNRRNQASRSALQLLSSCGLVSSYLNCLLTPVDFRPKTALVLDLCVV